MATFTNFYENIEEAVRRLCRTIVLYDNLPYSVIAISNHKKDGIFRIYLQPLGLDMTVPQKLPNAQNDIPPTHSGLGMALDNWMDDPRNEGHPILRKSMNSSKFNKFRPFPLGMCNFNGRCYYLERQPLRPKVEQGLIRGMVTESLITLADKREDRKGYSGEEGMKNIDIYSSAFLTCVTGNHPPADKVLKNLLDTDVINEAVAFDRNFALVRGPIGMIFLAYKADIVGAIPKLDFSVLRLGHNFTYCKEAVQELKLFGQIITASK